MTTTTDARMVRTRTAIRTALLTLLERSRLMALGLPLLVADDTRGSALAVCKYVSKHRAIWSALLTGGAAGAMREEFMRRAMHRGSSQVQKSSWLPVELGAIYGVSATVEILAWWLRQPEDFSVERIAEIVDRLVMAPSVGRETFGVLY